MQYRTKGLISLIFLVLLSWTSNSALAQINSSFNEQTKLIRIKKIATEWQGSHLTLHLKDGQEVSGQLIEVSGGNFHLQSGSRLVKIPLGEVHQVSFEPSTPEFLLSIASAFMGGAFLSGAIMIANDDASQQDVSLAALLGLLGGGLWGYSTFYETEVINLE